MFTRVLAVASLALSLLIPRSALSQITSNVFERVLLVGIGGPTPTETGTAFSIEVDGRQYLIRAKHLVSKLARDDSIELYERGTWSELKVKILKCDDPTDIAVLIPPHQVTPAL